MIFSDSSRSRGDVARELETYLEGRSPLKRPIFMEGPLGVGKSSLIKDTIATHCNRLRQTRSLAIFWGWYGGRAGFAEGGSVPSISVDFLVAQGDDRAGWEPADRIDWSNFDVFVEGVRPELFAGNVPRHLKGDVLRLLEGGVSVIVVVDKFDREAGERLQDADIEALDEWRERGVRVILELEEGAGGRNLPSSRGRALLRDPFEICLLGVKQEELEAIAIDCWEAGAGDVSKLSPSMKHRLVALTIQRCGQHIGTVAVLVHRASILLSLSNVEVDYAGCLDVVEKASRHPDVEQYLKLRCARLRRLERQVLIVVALAEQVDEKAQSLIAVWNRARGGTSEDLKIAQGLVSTLIDERGMLCGTQEAPRVNGELLAEVSLNLKSAHPIRESLGLIKVRSVGFNLARFLQLWALGIFSYLAISIYYLFGGGGEADALVRVVGGTAPPLLYVLVLGIKRAWLALRWWRK